MGGEGDMKIEREEMRTARTEERGRGGVDMKEGKEKEF